MKRRQLAGQHFLKVYGAFLRRHPELEQRVEEVMEKVAVGERAGLGIHSLRGKLAGFRSARISQSYRLVFALEPDAVVYIDIGSHEDVY